MLTVINIVCPVHKVCFIYDDDYDDDENDDGADNDDDDDYN